MELQDSWITKSLVAASSHGAVSWEWPSESARGWTGAGRARAPAAAKTAAMGTEQRIVTNGMAADAEEIDLYKARLQLKRRRGESAWLEGG